MSLVRITPLPHRVYVLNFRLHHGLTGQILVAIGVVLMAHDWRDRWWIRTKLEKKI